uniref:Putative secreted protein n=1 Tax=Anopheles marajoara TaxID=58244 RepID=A0A2M4CFG6_9DIPT
MPARRTTRFLPPPTPLFLLSFSLPLAHVLRCEATATEEPSPVASERSQRHLDVKRWSSTSWAANYC